MKQLVFFWQIVGMVTSFQILNDSLKRECSFDIARLLESRVRGVEQAQATIKQSRWIQALAVSHNQLALSCGSSVLIFSISSPHNAPLNDINDTAAKSWDISLLCKLPMQRGQVRNACTCSQLPR